MWQLKSKAPGYLLKSLVVDSQVAANMTYTVLMQHL